MSRLVDVSRNMQQVEARIAQPGRSYQYRVRTAVDVPQPTASLDRPSDQEDPIVVDPCYEKCSARAAQPGVTRKTKITACGDDELAGRLDTWAYPSNTYPKWVSVCSRTISPPSQLRLAVPAESCHTDVHSSIFLTITYASDLRISSAALRGILHHSRDRPLIMLNAFGYSARYTST